MKWFWLGGLLSAVWVVYSQHKSVEPLPHRTRAELDPQGQGENLGPQECREKGRTPFYIYPDGITPFFEECLRAADP
jgi:hypothetical protein